jgi:hypothetical protein
MNHIPAATVKHAAEIIESAADVEIGDIDVPVLMRAKRLREPLALAGRFAVPFSKQAGIA